jgi:hypothetical protein
MQDVQVPSPDHTTFDEICEKVDNWEPLPDPRTEPAKQGPEHRADAEPLDGLILAGLVAPY